MRLKLKLMLGGFLMLLSQLASAHIGEESALSISILKQVKLGLE